jgi:homoserine O-acetyltransferase
VARLSETPFDVRDTAPDRRRSEGCRSPGGCTMAICCASRVWRSGWSVPRMLPWSRSWAVFPRIAFWWAGAGWWPDIVGPNLGVDTTRFRVLGIDYLGGLHTAASRRRESLQRGSREGRVGGWPPRGPSPGISAHQSYDQADVLREVVRHLGLNSLHAIVGASYGGMVALCFAVRYAATVEHIVVVSAADKAQVLSTAWRSVQRQIVREAIARGDGPAGLKLARALAMATYRSQVEFATALRRAPVRDADRFRFPIEGYLFARGDDYVQKYRAESFLALSESIDLHHVDACRCNAGHSHQRARRSVGALQRHAGAASRWRGRARFVEINSIYGHDAFLKESAVP